MWLTMTLRNSLAWTSLPIPLSGIAVSLAMTVRSRFFCRTISSMIRSGVPTPRNPPIIKIAPSGIILTDSSREIVRMTDLSLERNFAQLVRAMRAGQQTSSLLRREMAQDGLQFLRFSVQSDPTKLANKLDDFTRCTLLRCHFNDYVFMTNSSHGRYSRQSFVCI